MREIEHAQQSAHVLTAEGIERRENRDRGLVETIFAPVLTAEEAIASHASFEQFGEDYDRRFTEEVIRQGIKVFHVAGNRQAKSAAKLPY